MVIVFKVMHTWVPTEYVKVEGSLHVDSCTTYCTSLEQYFMHEIVRSDLDNIKIGINSVEMSG